MAHSLRSARRERELIDGCVRIPLRESAVQACTDFVQGFLLGKPAPAVRS